MTIGLFLCWSMCVDFTDEEVVVLESGLVLVNSGSYL